MNKIELSPGDIFDTEFETGCVVITAPDIADSFLAYDGEGVECSFGVSMVKNAKRPAKLYSTQDFDAFIDLSDDTIVYKARS